MLILNIFVFQCSATCGQGKVHRKVTCLGTCDDQSKPHTTEDCHVSTACSQEWLTGRWTVCSHTCGDGIQSRTVTCTVTNRHGDRSTSDDRGCRDRKKPKTHRRCHIQKCPAEWFSSEWSKCSEQCGVAGVRTREVVCLKNYTLSDDCDEAPDSMETCRVNTCNSEAVDDDYQDTDMDDIDDDEYNEIDYLDSTTKAAIVTTKKRQSNKSRNTLSNEIVPEKYLKKSVEDRCEDKFKNCNVVVQSRLCRYSFYQSNCCRSCAAIADQRKS